MTSEILHVDHERLDEVDTESFDKKFDLDNTVLFRMGPAINTDSPFVRPDVIPSEDEDVFLTDTELHCLFPHRYGIDPNSISQQRQDFFTSKKNRDRLLTPPAFSSPTFFSPYKSLSKSPELRSPPKFESNHRSYFMTLPDIESYITTPSPVKRRFSARF